MPQDRAGAVKGTQSSNAGHGEGMPRVNQNYLDYVRSFAAPTKHFHNCLRAFTVGGGICCIGQFIRIGRNAGAGSIVPITGFANSVASPALEFKSEGLVTGLAAKMFVVAGPIIVYGVLSGAAVGLIYFLLNI